MSLALELLREIDAFVNANGMAETTFGRLATNDGKLVARLRGGKGITTGTVEKIRSYIRDNGPGSAASLSSSAANPAVLERIAGALRDRTYEVAPSEANFLWIRPPHLKAEELFRDLRELKVLVRYFPGETTGEYLRVSIGTDEEMDKFLTYLP